MPDPIAVVAIVVVVDGGGWRKNVFRNYLCKIVPAFSWPSLDNLVSSSMLASTPVTLFDSNVSAMARLAKTLVDTLLVALAIFSASVMAEYWVLM